MLQEGKAAGFDDALRQTCEGVSFSNLSYLSYDIIWLSVCYNFLKDEYFTWYK